MPMSKRPLLPPLLLHLFFRPREETDILKACYLFSTPPTPQTVFFFLPATPFLAEIPVRYLCPHFVLSPGDPNSILQEKRTNFGLLLERELR